MPDAHAFVLEIRTDEMCLVCDCGWSRALGFLATLRMAVKLAEDHAQQFDGQDA